MTTPLPSREGLGEGPPVNSRTTVENKEQCKCHPADPRANGENGRLLGRTRMSRRTLHHARQNRKSLTRAETILWSALSAKQLDGLKFTKQAVFDPFIADFTCRSAKLIVEVDGDSHAFTEAADARRTQFFAERGYRVIRFSNEDVMESLECVLREIVRAASGAPSPDPSLIGRGER